MQNNDDGRIGAFPANINKVNPNPRPDALAITGLIKQSGKISGYQLSDGQKVTREQGVELAKNNMIRGVGVAQKKETEYLRTLPDGDEANNISNLPTVGIE